MRVFSFFLAAGFSVSLSTKFSPFPIQLFAPFLALTMLRVAHIQALWLSIFCGLWLDLLQPSSSLGMHTVAFLIATLIAYPYKRYVFEEKVIPFSLFATFIGSFYTLFLALVQTVKNPLFSWTFPFIATDILFLPLCDAVFGWALFVFPLQFFTLFRKLFWRWRLS